jgi:rubrerythrin
LIAIRNFLNVAALRDFMADDKKLTEWHGIDRNKIDWHPIIDESKCIGCGYKMDSIMTQCPVCGTRFI